MFSGSIVALVTPMNASGEIDWKAFYSLIEWHIEKGTKGIVIAGTTGESATVDKAERAKLIARAVQRSNGKVSIIAGTGSNSTKDALFLTREAAAAGVAACLLVTPYYNKPTQEGLLCHYTSLADAVDIPQILYNVPARTACELSLETISILAKHPNIIGIKEASVDEHRVDDLVQLICDSFIVLSGEDFKNDMMMKKGAAGVISVTANVVPDMMADFCTGMLSGAIAQAEKLHNNLIPLHKALFLESNPIPVKWALHKMGYIDKGIRLPLLPLSTDAQAPLHQVLSCLELVR